MTDLVPVEPAPGVRLWAQALGPDDGAPLLLIGGGAWSMDWWDDELCARLAAAGHRVIRYDQRDTGAATSWPAGAPGYTGRDLVSDAVAVLDAFGVGRAHVAGLSMGGGVAQRLALEHPGRVRALTLIATSPAAPTSEDLPGMSPELEVFLADEGPGPDWTDPVAAVNAVVEGERVFAGSGAFDEARIRAIAERVVARTADLAAGMTNHFVLEAGPGPTALGPLGAVPVLVVHGAVDPLLPLPHGRALADATGGRLLALEGMGHQLPPPHTWDALLAALAETDPVVPVRGPV